jgi:hypothetical protein
MTIEFSTVKEQGSNAEYSTGRESPGILNHFLHFNGKFSGDLGGNLLVFRSINGIFLEFSIYFG